MRIVRNYIWKVKDINPATASLAGQYTDVSRVEKFEISDQEYAARRGSHHWDNCWDTQTPVPFLSDTVLAYKQAHKVGRFAPPSGAEIPENSYVDIHIGSRCKIDAGEGELEKRGTVRFVGPTKFAKGVWVGIEYDEPLGKNDGSWAPISCSLVIPQQKYCCRVQGERYFTTRQSYGGFVRPDRVRVGDFPVEDLDMNDEEM